MPKRPKRGKARKPNATKPGPKAPRVLAATGPDPASLPAVLDYLAQVGQPSQWGTLLTGITRAHPGLEGKLVEVALSDSRGRQGGAALTLLTALLLESEVSDADRTTFALGAREAALAAIARGDLDASQQTVAGFARDLAGSVLPPA